MRIRKALAAVALSLWAGAAGGCASTEALRGLPPFFERAYAKDDDMTDVVLRPFFRFRDQPRRDDGAGVDRTDLHYLFPLGHYKRRGSDVEHRLWPLFLWTRRTDADGFVARKYLFFPFVWGGHLPGEGSYFTLWPLGGSFRSLWGKDEVWHVLFPLFAYTRLHDWRSYHFLFPLFAYHSGEGNTGFRVMPLFGFQKKERDGQLVSERYSVLFPFFAWERDNANTRNPFTAWVVFPVYGQTRSDLVEETTVLWPFFRKRVEKKDGITRWRVPFPFVMLAFGNETQVDLWPFFGWRRNGGFSRTFALWPFIRTERHDRGDAVAARHWVMPFASTFEERDAASGAVLRRSSKFWPLVQVERRRDGAYGFAAPSLLWFKDSPEENFETVLTPLLELVRYRDDPQRGKELRLLFSSFVARWGAAGAAEEEGWSILGGLLGRRTTREGDRRLRLFYFFEI